MKFRFQKMLVVVLVVLVVAPVGADDTDDDCPSNAPFASKKQCAAVKIVRALISVPVQPGGL
jgi:hypothetical protein